MTRSVAFTLLVFISAAATAAAAAWPQWLGPQRDAVWRENGIVKTFPKGGLKPLWRTPVRPGYSGPAVADGRVFLMDRRLAEGARNPDNVFKRGNIPGDERILCLDAGNGTILWEKSYTADYTVSYPKGPRATPTVDGERVYTLGAEGHLHCLNVKDGSTVWSRIFSEDYGARTPTWGHAAHPLIDGDKLICLVGGEGSAVVAFHKETGKELWRALTSKDIGYCPPVIYEAAGERQLIIWHTQAVVALNPDTGKVLWEHPWDVRGGGSITIPRKLDDHLFLGTFFNGSLMLKLNSTRPGVEKLWQSPKITTKDTIYLHSLNCTPWLGDGLIYGVCNYGQFRCLRVEDGQRLWESLKPVGLEKPRRNANAFIIRHEDRFFICSDNGDLAIAKLSAEGYVEIDRAKLIEPTDAEGGRPIVWSHPAFANRSVYARNDKEIVCVSLAVGDPRPGQ
ncbi:MAG: outer membrane protein assembly factor BamB [Candidatus Binatia bacterium]|jgi:outer membrane protein assembly factor BamB